MQEHMRVLESNGITIRQWLESKGVVSAVVDMSTGRLVSFDDGEDEVDAKVGHYICVDTEDERVWQQEEEPNPQVSDES